MEKNKNSSYIETELLKLIYYEIINGSSFDSENSLFVKHFSEKENFLIQKKKIELFYEYSRQGIPNESELLKSAIQNEQWSTEKEDKILELKYAISDNEKNINTIIAQQRPLIKKAIDKDKEKLSKLIEERKNTLGKSLEDLMADNLNEYFSFISLFKDEECKIPAFSSFEEFEELDFLKLIKLNESIISIGDKFSELNIKKIAVMPFFLNKFSYSKEDITKFLGIPVYKLTYNQSLLFSNGIRNLNILENTESQPPDLSLDGTIDSLVNWYDIQNSILISKRKQSK